ncbi:MAG: DUF2339 domain-containing protein, partial [Rhodobacteraceae bacterium]|nr:DUF2339 domain-containing protein [Paracoccaceae bacterium]
CIRDSLSPAAPPPAAPPQPPLPPPRRTAGRFLGWLRSNAVHVVAAASLALAGIFLVQYGIERGLIPPGLRVLAALALGAALIGSGEWIRRRWGDAPESPAAYLPSTFSGAGIVSMAAGIVAARGLYGLIGPGQAFAGLVAVSALAILLGWLHGPLLAAVGLVGAAAAPFIVGGSSQDIGWLYGYFALLAAVGLSVDTLRRWAWVSVLATVLAAGGGYLAFTAGAPAAGLMALLAGLVPMTVAIPARGLVPDHAGPSLAEARLSHGAAGRTSFPVRLAAVTAAAAAAAIVLLPAPDPGTTMVALLLLAGLAVLLALWTIRAPGIADIAAFPAAGFLAVLLNEGWNAGPLWRDWSGSAIVLRPPETAPPATAGVIVALAACVTLAAAWRSFADARLRLPFATAAAVFAPAALVVLETLWAPSLVLGPYPWALHAAALAALMTLLAERFARADGPDRRRAAHATLSALSLIALALMLVLSAAALTVALAVLVVVAAALDRAFRLPEMGWFIQAGVLALGYRLTVDPGLAWAVDAPVGQVVLAFGGAVAGMVAARATLAPLDRRAPAVILESGAAGAAALLANVLLMRAISSALGDDATASHWSFGLNAVPWLVVMLVQLWRDRQAGIMRIVRRLVAIGAALLGGGFLAAAVTLGNPLSGGLFGDDRVLGPPVLDTLAAAYALPGLLLAAAAWRLPGLGRVLRPFLAAAGAALLLLYAGLQIRRFWRGDDLSVPGVTQPELYTYTVALLVLGGLLLYQALARRSVTLRRLAMAVIALTVAKVFLIDVSGLSGLTRVFSFLALGLSLAGLAWLNRWAAGRQEGEAAPADPEGQA